jgi:glycosyltransferase involved in cell wall biosynthesis
MAGQRAQCTNGMIDVSVVMSVFNGEGSLAATLESVLGQQGCRFELIVVDDGSTDATPRMLDAVAARDARVRVFHQPNAGLTRALARGCAEARGEFIARQDCGDISLPARLEQQWRHLEQHPETVMVACAVRFVGPGDEPLFVTSRPGSQLHAGLAMADVKRIQGPPHHGGTMFRRAAYLQAGGYRANFPVAQDIDLWLRLREVGRCEGLAHVGYQARLEAGSISARRRTEQIRFAALAIECARRRGQGQDEREVLAAQAAAGVTSRGPFRSSERFERAKFLYFIASCLRQTDPAAAKRYYWKAFHEHPLMVKSLIRLAIG